MNTDSYLVRRFKQSHIYSWYIEPTVSLEERIIRRQVPETMYAFLINLAEESAINVEPHKKMYKVLRYDLVEELCNRFPSHEGILILQSSLGGKFYRDHMMHMFRVMLLANIIGDTLELDKNKLIACALAGLFHDIAYPLCKAIETINHISESLRRCYPYHEIQGSSLRLLPSQDEIDKVLKICKEKELTNLGKESNHAILSALAFLNLWDSESIEQDENLCEIVDLATHAIAVHDSEIKRTVKYSQDPVSAILILADELQDWGRPVGWDESSWTAIPDIEPFLVTKGEIHAGFDYSGSEEYNLKTDDVFSALLQIQSKQENMSRIVLDDDSPKLTLVYQLPDYSMFSYDSIVSCVKEVRRYEGEVMARVLHTTNLDEYLATFGDPSPRLPVSMNRLCELNDFSNRLSDVFYDSVTKSKVPLHLHYNAFTGEYVIHSGKKIPTKIIATKNRKGKVEWNYRLRELEKPLKSSPLRPRKLGVRTDRLFSIIGMYDIPFDEAEKRLQLIDHSQPVQSFVALLQLLHWVYSETFLIWQKADRQDGDDVDLSQEALHIVAVLQRSYDPRCRFFLLEDSGRE